MAGSVGQPFHSVERGASSSVLMLLYVWRLSCVRHLLVLSIRQGILDFPLLSSAGLHVFPHNLTIVSLVNASTTVS